MSNSCWKGCAFDNNINKNEFQCDATPMFTSVFVYHVSGRLCCVLVCFAFDILLRDLQFSLARELLFLFSIFLLIPAGVLSSPSIDNVILLKENRKNEKSIVIKGASSLEVDDVFDYNFEQFKHWTGERDTKSNFIWNDDREDRGGIILEFGNFFNLTYLVGVVNDLNYVVFHLCFRSFFFSRVYTSVCFLFCLVSCLMFVYRRMFLIDNDITSHSSQTNLIYYLYDMIIMCILLICYVVQVNEDISDIQSL